MARIELPGKFSGADVLVAFRNAATYEIAGVQKWSPRTNKTKDGSATGWEAYCAVWHVPGRLFRAFGARPVWSTQDTRITLVPLDPAVLHDAVSIEIAHRVNIDLEGYPMYIIGLDNPRFAPFRPAYDEIIRRFFTNLAKRQVAA